MIYFFEVVVYCGTLLSSYFLEEKLKYLLIVLS